MAGASHEHGAEMSTEDDDVTKPSASEHRVTQQLPAVSAVEILLTQIQQSMTLGFRETNANIDLVTGDVRSLKADVRGLQEWKIALEKAPPLTSERARAIVDEHASHVDLAAQAREAAALIKDEDRDRQIAETRDLAEHAATKDDVSALATSTATRAEVECMLAPTAEKVDRLTATQDVQLAILARLDKVASNPTVKVIAGMVATAILTWLAAHSGFAK
jgi:hypothetical protein